MPKLKADFAADWIAHLRSCLINGRSWLSTEIEALSDSDVPHRYFDAQLRRIVSVPRTIKIGDTFSCPSGCEAGWSMLKEKVRKGEDINSHLSKKHISLSNSDGLLSEWGIHHFHLGTSPCLRDPAYVNRTKHVLYAIVGDRTFYVINIYDHSNFENIDLFESIHRNWPEMIKRYIAKGLSGGNWAKEEKRKLRHSNLNATTTASDGTVYLPIGGGVTMSGLNFEAVRVADSWLLKIRHFQSKFEKQLTELLPTLAKNGYSGEDILEAKLQAFSDYNAEVFFPKYDVIAKVKLSSCNTSEI